MVFTEQSMKDLKLTTQEREAERELVDETLDQFGRGMHLPYDLMVICERLAAIKARRAALAARSAGGRGSRMCVWCYLRSKGRMFRFSRPYGRLWTFWRARRYCPRCAPPRSSRAGRLVIAHNALITEIRSLHDDVVLAARLADGREGGGE